jgi:hypothetical protein
VGNFRGRWGNLNTMDKIRFLGISDKRRKNICTYNKEVGRERVSLSKPSPGIETAGRGPIDENRKGDSSDTSHNGVNQLMREVHSFKSGLYEIPF